MIVINTQQLLIIDHCRERSILYLKGAGYCEVCRLDMEIV